MTSHLEEETRRECAWCGDPIAPRMRKGTRSCSKACRQSLSRFRVAPAGSVAAKPMRFGYADPPYPKKAKYYGANEVDHVRLLGRLIVGYPDGWAMSTSADAIIPIARIAYEVLGPTRALRELRVAVWNRGARAGKSLRPRNAWEPLIVCGGRPVATSAASSVTDVLTLAGTTRHLSMRTYVVGTKPPGFCEWMFRLLGAQVGDQLDDLFPGSGSVGRAWSLFQRSASRPAARDVAAGRRGAR